MQQTGGPFHERDASAAGAADAAWGLTWGDRAGQRGGGATARLLALRRRAEEMQGARGPEREIARGLLDVLAALESAEAALAEQRSVVVAERERAAEERRHYTELFELAPDAYLLTDGAGVIRSANHAALELFGLPAGRLLGTRLAEVARLDGRRELDDLVRALASLADARAARALADREWPVVVSGSDGRVTHALATVAPVFAKDGYCVELRWLLRDATERWREEVELRCLNGELERRIAERTTQLELASRAQREFVARMSHEFRTPLQAIMGFSELLREGIPAPTPEYARSRGERIHGAAEQLLALVEEILSLSRLEQERELLRPEAVDVRALAEAAAGDAERLARRKGLSFDASLPPEGTLVTTDPAKLRRIVRNLLANAVKYTWRGEVSLTVDVDDAGAVRIEVRDTGIGIAADRLERIFDPLCPAEPSAGPPPGGIGLGLRVARRLVELLGGTIGASSTVGAGTTFSVQLPPLRSGADQAPSDASIAATSSK